MTEQTISPLRRRMIEDMTIRKLAAHARLPCRSRHGRDQQAGDAALPCATASPPTWETNCSTVRYSNRLWP
jgi:hypothetical protein